MSGVAYRASRPPGPPTRTRPRGSPRWRPWPRRPAPEREREHHRGDPEAATAPPRRPRPQRERRRRDRDRHHGLPRRDRRHGDPDRDDREGDPRDAGRLSAPRDARQRPVAGPIQRRGARGAGVVLCHDQSGGGLASTTMPAWQAQVRAWQAPAPPDGDDQDVGSDEQHDEAQNLQGEVSGEAGVEDVRVEAPRRCAVEERAEEQRGERHADGGVAPEQGHGDADVADVRDLDVEDADPELPPEDVHRAAEACEGAGDRHRQEVALGDADAAVAGRLGVAAHGPHPEAEGRARQDQPVGHQGADGDEDADVEALEDRVAPEHGEPRRLDHVVRDRHRPPRPAAGRRTRRGNCPPSRRSS